MDVIITVWLLIAFLGFCAWKIATDADTPPPTSGGIGSARPDGRSLNEQKK